jgi:hypothetical protein
MKTAPDIPSSDVVSKMIKYWNNSAVADPDYVTAVMKYARDSTGPILECGSGLTTIVLAIYSSQSVITLESDSGWHRRLRSEMTWLGLDSGGLREAPLRQYEGFLWYDLPCDLPDKFALVVCDGPPLSDQPGGRIGLMSVMGDRMSRGAVILADSDMQFREGPAIDDWQANYQVKVSATAGTELVMVAP